MRMNLQIAWTLFRMLFEQSGSVPSLFAQKRLSKYMYLDFLVVLCALVFIYDNTVKQLISAVSNFLGLMKMTYWRISVLALMISNG